MREIQEFFADPDNWPDESAKDWPPEWRMFYLSTKWGYTDFAALMEAIDENGKGEVFNDVLVQLGYSVAEEGSGMKGIHLTRRDGMYAMFVFLWEKAAVASGPTLTPQGGSRYVSKPWRFAH